MITKNVIACILILMILGISIFFLEIGGMPHTNGTKVGLILFGTGWTLVGMVLAFNVSAIEKQTKE